ncbi:MAG: dTDP-4-dehydrorhamnose reductase [Ferruginibacter sp.]
MINDTKPQKNILITGAQGQLGSEFKALAEAFPGFHFIFHGRDEMDITDEKAVADFFDRQPIRICVNCAAYTAVDKAEEEKEIAEKINSNATAYLAKACKKHNSVLFHISTDYVFNGRGTQPYKPDDTTDPVNFYGITKLAGEQKAKEENPGTIIIRTSWVYSSFGKNFVKTMLRLMHERESIGVVADQKGTPTYAADLAAGIMQIIKTENFVPGIYHYTNGGETTWYGFAKEIAAQIRSGCIVNPLTTDQFPTPAKRPAYSVMAKEKIIDTFNISIPQWEDSLKVCLAKIRG